MKKIELWSNQKHAMGGGGSLDHGKTPNMNFYWWSVSLQLKEPSNIVIKTLKLFGINTRSVIKFEKTKYLHIALGRKDLFIDWLRRHPFNWQFLLFLYFVHFMIHFAHQTKVRNLQLFTMSNQNISCCQISVNEALFREVILVKWKK